MATSVRARRLRALGILVAGCVVGLGCGRGANVLAEAPMNMKLESMTFAAGAMLPTKCSADGGNVSPELHWSGIPNGTRSLAIIVQDPDAPGSTPFVHWLAFDIPPTVDTCAEGRPPNGAILGQNDAGTEGYFGPKPPSGTHHYIFRVYALDNMPALQAGAGMGQVAAAMQGHTLAMGELTGLFAH